MAYDPFFDRPALLILVQPVEIDEPLEIVGLEVLRLHAGELLDISLDPGVEDGSEASGVSRIDLVALVCELQAPHEGEGIVRLLIVVD